MRTLWGTRLLAFFASATFPLLNAHAASAPSSSASAGSGSVIQVPCKVTGSSSELGLRDCTTVIGELKATLESKTPIQDGKVAQGDLRRIVSEIYSGKMSKSGRKLGTPVCNILPGIFNDCRAENTSSCGKFAKFEIKLTKLETDMSGDYYVRESSYIRGIMVHAINVNYMKVMNEITTSKRLTVSDSCAYIAEEYASLSQRSGKASFKLQEQLAGQKNIADIENCTDASGAATNPNLQSACYLKAARAVSETLFTQFAKCEILARATVEYEEHVVDANAEIRSDIDAKVRAQCDKGIETKEDELNRCYQREVEKLLKNDVMLKYWPGDTGCSNTSSRSDPSQFLFVGMIGLAGPLARRRRRTVYGLVTVALASLNLGGSCKPPKMDPCLAVTGEKATEEKCCSVLACGYLEYKTQGTYDQWEVDACAEEQKAYNEAAAGWIDSGMSYDCGQEDPDTSDADCAAAESRYNAARSKFTDCIKALEDSCSDDGQHMYPVPEGCPGAASDAVGGEEDSLPDEVAGASGAGVAAITAAENALGISAGADVDEPVTSATSAAANQLSTGAAVAGALDSYKKDRAGASTESPQALTFGGANGTGGQGGGSSGSGGAGPGGSNFGDSGSTSASTGSAATGGGQLTGGAEGGAYESGGGAGSGSAGSGRGGNSGAAFSGSSGSTEFGARSPAEAESLGSPDPEDYFTRVGLSDNLFKVVERRYRAKAAGWAVEKASRVLEDIKK